MKVMKFGGTSVGSASAIKKSFDIVMDTFIKDEPLVVVCSAMKGITDKLVECSHLASKRDSHYEQIYASVCETHRMCAQELGIGASLSVVLEELLGSLQETLRGIYLLGECTPRSRDLIMSFGERLSCLLVWGFIALRESSTRLIDTRSVLITDDRFGNATIKPLVSFQRIRECIPETRGISVVTGFIAATDNGDTTTLGRGGSDYTASIFGAALGADEVQIWTDVNGVLSADPRLVHGAQTIDEMTYEEAMEMSHFGAKVIYSPTMQPAREMGIPIVIKNTFEPTHPGTRIHAFSTSTSSMKGISSIKSVALIRVSGSGMVGVSGIAGRMFTALASVGVNIIMISQGSSEHSICAVIAPEQAMLAVRVLKEAFALEILQHQIDDIVLESQRSVIAVIGERMRQVPGIGGKIFSALGDYGVNVVAIAQGSSERNVSIVVEESEVSQAMQAIHDRFFTQKRAPLQVVIVGTGLVGGTLIKQLMARSSRDPEVLLCGVANSKYMLLSDEGVDIGCMQTHGQPTDLRGLVDWFKRADLPHPVFVDSTASDAPVALYEELLHAGVSVVTPNKRATSGEWEAYKRLKQAARGCVFRYETNVGAGLPVIGVIQSLLGSGDNIHRIEGTLSGTLSYLFNTYQAGMSFTDLLRDAREKGYTEPDPRDDLSGVDVARKLLILAREIGLELELGDVEVESLVPESCRDIQGVETFFEALHTHDQVFAQRLSRAASQGQRLRYVARISNGCASVNLESVDESHPCYGLSGSDNLISFTTDRYRDRPLVVRGPGAGAEVTAAGVLADILSCSHE